MFCLVTNSDGACSSLSVNDASTTTQRKVLGLFQRVIDRLDGGAERRRWRRQVRQLLKGAATTAMQSPEQVDA